MLSRTALVFSILVLHTACNLEDLSFPPGFKFGVASSAYQVEGAWNVSDKSESIWDRFSHKTPSVIADGSTGDVACDSYHLWKEDVALVAELGAHFYRISIAWSRLLPNGFPHRISEDGKNYYNNLINGLLEKGIEPVLTLYHWDLPQRLQDLGGWTNPLIADWFTDYARVVYSLYGDRVKTWITINEAWVVCDVSYVSGFLAPGIASPEGVYLCTKNVVMAHAKAWKVYDEEFKPKYHGQVSLAQHHIWMEAANEKEEPTAELVRQYLVGRFSHPIFSKEGGWPPAIETAVANFSRKEGYTHSLLPAFTKNEIEFIKGTYDFYAVNHYTSQLIRRSHDGEQLRPWPLGDVPLFNAKMEIHPDWPLLSPFYANHPEGLRKQLAWLKQRYGDMPILITENGRGTKAGLDDKDRIEYYSNYMKQVLLAIKEDGVNVTGYTAWALTDNFEWVYGYKSKFGLYEVDFTSPKRTRTARASAKYYASVIKSNSLDVSYNFRYDAAPKSSKPEESKTAYIVFGGLVMVVIAVAIAAVVGCRMRSRARLEKKHRYAAVIYGQGDNQNGNHGNDTRNAQNGTQNGEVDETRIPLTT